MSVLDTVKARFSVRAYTEQAVEEEKLQKILEIAHVAPTAANRQRYNEKKYVKAYREDVTCMN